jgi:peptide/nickel transport system permease protein
MSAAPSSIACGETYSQRVWRVLRRNRFAMAGLAFIIVLFAIASLSSLLADSKPILMISPDGEWSSPLFRSMTDFDLRFLAYGVGTALIVVFRRAWTFRTGIWIVIFFVAMVELICWFHVARLDGNDYRRLAGWKIMPPIPYSPTEITPDILAPPSWQHFFGTDSDGRDVASRMIHGAKISLTIGFVAEGIAVLIGTIFGALAGYFRRATDIVLSRIIEIMECFPTLFLIIAVTAMVRPSLFTIMIVIGATSWTGIARMVRGEYLKYGSMPFAHAAQALGAGHLRIMVLQILPNAIGPILVIATFGVAGAILVEASLAFLGFGVPPPTPTWGDTLSDARRYIDLAWWLATFPGLAIFITITSYNLLGEGLRDAIDPRLRV